MLIGDRDSKMGFMPEINFPQEVLDLLIEEGKKYPELDVYNPDDDDL